MCKHGLRVGKVSWRFRIVRKTICADSLQACESFASQIANLSGQELCAVLVHQKHPPVLWTCCKPASRLQALDRKLSGPELVAILVRSYACAGRGSEWAKFPGVSESAKNRFFGLVESL